MCKDNAQILDIVEKFSNKEQDENLINKIIEDIISQNSKQVEEYKWKDKNFRFLLAGFKISQRC